jgi:carbamoyl-phosphate synthase large subunit
VEEAEKIAAELGYPVVIRPAYTMGGTVEVWFTMWKN